LAANGSAREERRATAAGQGERFVLQRDQQQRPRVWHKHDAVHKTAYKVYFTVSQLKVGFNVKKAVCKDCKP
jgi:hypothetical protein